MAIPPRGAPTGRRPVPVLLQWAALCALIALGWSYRPRVVPTPYLSDAARTNWDGFLAIRYRALQRESGDDGISPVRLREQLEALRDAGYEPIGLLDARRFLEEGLPLPQQAVLITIDDARLRSVRDAERVLADLRFPATLTVPADLVESLHHSYPTWHHLVEFEATQRWSFRFKGAGPDAGAAFGGRELLARAKSAAGALDFPGVGYALNAHGRSAQALTRLTVEPGWSGSDLVAWLDAHKPRHIGVEAMQSIDWVLRSGTVTAAGDAVTLATPDGPSAAGRGAEGWLAGTETWRSVAGGATVSLDAEQQVWIQLRASPPESFVRLGWSGKRFELQARAPGGAVETLATAESSPGATIARIEFDLHDRHIRFHVEGAAAPRRSFPLPVSLGAGMVGVCLWRLGDGAGATAITGLRLFPRTPRVAVVDGLDGARRVLGESLDVLAPRALRLVEADGALQLRGAVDPALALLAGFHGSALWPVVTLEAAPRAGGSGQWLRELEATTRQNAVDGLLLDLRPLHDAGRPMTPDAISVLLAGITRPIGVILDRDPATFLAEFPWKKLQRIAVHAGAPGVDLIPSDALLILFEDSQR